MNPKAGRGLLKGGLIKNHLRNMLILGIPMNAVCGGMLFPRCRLRFLDGDAFAVAGASRAGGDDRMALAYTIDGYIYGLETVVASECRPSSSEALPILLPQRISRIERRRSYRVSCPEDEPVAVLLASETQEVKTDAVVISDESVALSLPPDAAVGIDSLVAMTLCLPRLGDITVKGTVRFIRDSSGNQGLVVRFDEVSDADRDLLRRYIRTRQIADRPDEGGGRRESGFMVTKSFDGRKHVFWCPAHLLGSMDVVDEALQVISVDALDFI